MADNTLPIEPSNNVISLDAQRETPKPLTGADLIAQAQTASAARKEKEDAERKRKNEATKQAYRLQARPKSNRPR